ncbi:MAG TPA: hypothetical protein VE988_01115 [Gemmataceae bacterium]|nr:hypothetical protein [Gemmataceae bacterium]
MTNKLSENTMDIPFFAGMALLVASLLVITVGVWQLWEIIFAPEPSNLTCASEAAALGVMIHDANQSYWPGRALKERLDRGLATFQSGRHNVSWMQPRSSTANVSIPAFLLAWAWQIWWSDRKPICCVGG